MTRHVFDHRQLAHVWAQQTQTDGRGSSMYFDGPTIYSYGRHFPIAKFVERKGRKCVLFTTKTYSVSTAKHIGYVRGALRGHDIPVFNVVHPTDTDHKANAAGYKYNISSVMKSAAKARTNAQMYMDRAFELTTEANAYAAFFGLRWRLKDPQFTDEFIAKVRDTERKTRAKIRAAQIRRGEELHEAIQLWLKHEEPAGSYLPYNHGDTLLRITGDEVETSRGAKVPLRHAKRLWSHVLRIKRRDGDSGVTIVGSKIGLFTVNRIEGDGTLVVGCHTIKFAEMERLAVQLGLPH